MNTSSSSSLPQPRVHVPIQPLKKSNDNLKKPLSSSSSSKRRMRQMAGIREKKIPTTLDPKIDAMKARQKEKQKQEQEQQQQQRRRSELMDSHEISDGDLNRSLSALKLSVSTTQSSSMDTISSYDYDSTPPTSSSLQQSQVSPLSSPLKALSTDSCSLTPTSSPLSSSSSSVATSDVRTTPPSSPFSSRKRDYTAYRSSSSSSISAYSLVEESASEEKNKFNTNVNIIQFGNENDNHRAQLEEEETNQPSKIAKISNLEKNCNGVNDGDTIKDDINVKNSNKVIDETENINECINDESLSSLSLNELSVALIISLIKIPYFESEFIHAWCNKVKWQHSSMHKMFMDNHSIISITGDNNNGHNKNDENDIVKSMRSSLMLPFSTNTNNNTNNNNNNHHENQSIPTHSTPFYRDLSALLCLIFFSPFCLSTTCSSVMIFSELDFNLHIREEKKNNDEEKEEKNDKDDEEEKERKATIMLEKEKMISLTNLSTEWSVYEYFMLLKNVHTLLTIEYELLNDVCKHFLLEIIKMNIQTSVDKYFKNKLIQRQNQKRQRRRRQQHPTTGFVNSNNSRNNSQSQSSDEEKCSSSSPSTSCIDKKSNIRESEPQQQHHHSQDDNEDISHHHLYESIPNFISTSSNALNLKIALRKDIEEVRKYMIYRAISEMTLTLSEIVRKGFLLNCSGHINNTTSEYIDKQICETVHVALKHFFHTFKHYFNTKQRAFFEYIVYDIDTYINPTHMLNRIQWCLTNKW